MNWYRIATLIEEIKRIGPNSPVTDLDDPRVLYLSEKWGLSPEEALLRFKNNDFGNMGEFYKRDYFTQNYGWSVPSEDSIEKVKDFVGGDNIIEIGSGYGMWAKVMQDAGISITATDSFSNRGEYVPVRNKSFTDVEDLEAMEAIQKYSGYNVLMLSWPPYDDPMATNTLKSFSGNKLIFVGEDCGGCTADDEFFKVLGAFWNNVDWVDIPKWWGIHDSLSLWERK